YWSGLRGAKWVNGHYADANYNHHLLPNDSRWDCSNVSHNPGQAAARSLHSGGVNILLGDGSVRFVSNNINPNTWQALATRAGNVDPATCTLEVIAPDGKRYDLKERLVHTGYTPKEGFWTTVFTGAAPGMYLVAHTSDQVVSYAPKRSVKSAKSFFVVSPSL